MKIIAIALSLLTFSLQNATAQRDRGSVYAGAGIANFSIQSVKTLSVFAAFEKTFSDPVLLEFSGSYSTDKQLNAMDESVKLESFGVSLLALYRIVFNDQQHLKLGGGISGRFFNEHWMVEPDRFTPTSAFKPGLNLTARYDIILQQQWILGFSAWLERYGKNNSVYIVAAHAGYQF